MFYAPPRLRRDHRHRKGCIHIGLEEVNHADGALDTGLAQALRRALAVVRTSRKRLGCAAWNVAA
jgi:hypothetical protein